MKVLKCGSQTNLLPPQVEQKPSLTQIRLAVVFGGGWVWRGFVFKPRTCLMQNYPSALALYLKTSVNPPPLPKEAPKPPKPPHRTPTPPPCPAATCVRGRKAKQHSHKHFHWRGKFSSCVTQCPIDFQRITFIYSTCSAGPKCSR